MAFNPLAGKDVKVKISTTEYAFRVAEVMLDAKLGDVTNFTSAGAQQVIEGPFKGKITLRGPHDGGNMDPFEVNQPVSLDIEYSNSLSYSLACLVESVKVTGDLEKPQEVEVVVQTNGVFTPGMPS